MAITITIPRLGWDMTEGVFAGWLKQDGETVSPGDALFSLETDKATQDVETLDGGVLRIPPDGPKPGDRLAVGMVIGYLVGPGEPAPSAPVSADAASDGSIEAAGPAVRRQARELGIDLRRVAGTGASGRVTAEDIQKYQGGCAGAVANAEATAHHQPAISPRAKRLATQRGIDWRQLRGSGRTGRIRERDVREATIPSGGSQATKMPLSSIRQTIAERMLRSGQLTAPVTLTTTADATELVHLRNQFKASVQSPMELVPSYTDFLMKLLATALRQHPLLNARWEEDHIVVEQGIHIGIAVDTEAGLLVPVVRDVPSLGVRQLAARSRDLIDRARQRRLGAEEMQGGTFTITNLGPFGIDAFTPIINHPECAILGVGRIQRQAVMVENQVVGRDRVTLSLTFDHRIVDGAPAARFLQALCKLIENPSPWLIG
jgi:pyruvate dehydrogenase E2 component (dihydrolipoamide acetyltransferase)